MLITKALYHGFTLFKKFFTKNNKTLFNEYKRNLYNQLIIHISFFRYNPYYDSILAQGYKKYEPLHYYNDMDCYGSTLRDFYKQPNWR